MKRQNKKSRMLLAGTLICLNLNVEAASIVRRDSDEDSPEEARMISNWIARTKIEIEERDREIERQRVREAIEVEKRELREREATQRALREREEREARERAIREREEGEAAARRSTPVEGLGDIMARKNQEEDALRGVVKIASALAPTGLRGEVAKIERIVLEG